MTESKIVMIPIGDLEHHPENPRKDLGDLSELTDSIRKNGIYQNLTVVADLDRAKYLVVIGNRRLEAAKAAGLVELPCVISDMDHKEQIATMLEENMQRQDLTVFEQAQGFQMMMDLGYSPKQISEKTGFSEKTVKDRIKFTKFNQKKFENAVANGATLMDLIEVSKLDGKREQNEVMDAIGTNNFRSLLKTKLQEQTRQKIKERTEPILKEYAEPLPENANIWGMNPDYTGKELEDIDDATVPDEKIRKIMKKNKKIFPDDQLFYSFRAIWGKDTFKIEIYRKAPKTAKQLSEEEKTERQRTLTRNKHVKKVKEQWAIAFELRRDFIRNYSVNVNGTGISTIGKLIPRYALEQRPSWGTTYNHQWDKGVILDLLGIQTEEYEDKSATIWEMIESRSDVPMIRAIVAWICGGGIFWPDDPEHGLYSSYDGSFMKQSTKDNGLTKLYEFLKEIGYQMSDMEIQLMDGTHPVYQTEE